MAVGLDPGVRRLFGSGNRARTLAVLASVTRPLTGYRVAQLAGAQRIKVNRELRQLARGGLVVRRRTAAGRNGWLLSDPDLRAFLAGRVRVTFPDAWAEFDPSKGRAVRERLTEIMASLPDPRESPDFYRPPGWRPSAQGSKWIQEMIRPAGKDRILRRAGARTSERKRRAV
jgi:hypothetical protein